jgi:hypothetical protein
MTSFTQNHLLCYMNVQQVASNATSLIGEYRGRQDCRIKIVALEGL